MIGQEIPRSSLRLARASRSNAPNMQRVRMTERRRLRILACSSEMPDPTLSSGHRRFFTMLHLLARRFEVDLCVFRYTGVPDAGTAAKLLQRGVRLHNYPAARFAATHPLLWMSMLAASNQFDVAIIECFHLAEHIMPTIRRLQPDLKIIVDSVDVHFLREQAAAELGLCSTDQAETTKQRELRVYRDADAVIAITVPECKALHSLVGMPPVFIVPNLLPIHERKKRQRKRELLFIGFFDHKPNVDGILWFVNDVWPVLRIEVPDAELTIVGAAMPDEVLALGRLPGITTIGYVPDTLEYLDRAAVSIAPLRYGGGMKGKVTEAMAAGVPVVATSVGTQGIPAVSGIHLVIGDTADEFASAIIFLLRNRTEAERIGPAGQELVAQLCGIEAGERALQELLDGVVVPAARTPLFPAYGFGRLIRHLVARRTSTLNRSRPDCGAPGIPLQDGPTKRNEGTAYD